MAAAECGSEIRVPTADASPRARGADPGRAICRTPRTGHASLSRTLASDDAKCQVPSGVLRHATAPNAAAESGPDVAGRRRLSQHRARMNDDVDVVIITAADGEDEGVRAVVEGALGKWLEDNAPVGAHRVWRNTFRAREGGALRVALTKALAMGVEASATAVTELSAALDPQCIAMCGICAGRPKWTDLGDVIVATKVYRYDVGAIREQEGVKTFTPDMTTYQLPALWKSMVDRVKVPEYIPWELSREEQAQWLLRELGLGRDPLTASDRKVRCPDWANVLEFLRSQPDARLALEALSLSDAGRTWVRLDQEEYPDGPPPRRPPRVWAYPMATGSALRQSDRVWDDVAQHDRLVAAIDMEAAAIGFAGWASDRKHVVVKGVMDFAEPNRSHGYRRFPARASAEVLIALLREVLVPRKREVERPAPRPVRVWLGDTFAIGPRPRVAVSWAGIGDPRVASLHAQLVAAAELEFLELCDPDRPDAWLTAAWRPDTSAFEVALVAEAAVAPALPSAAAAQAAVLAELAQPEGPRVVAQRLAARTAALLVRCPSAWTNVDRAQLRARLYGAGIIVAAKNWEKEPEVAVSAVELLCAARDILPESDFEALADRRAAVEACVRALVNLAMPSDASIARQARRLAAALLRAVKDAAAERQLRTAFPDLQEALAPVRPGLGPLQLTGPQDSDLASSLHEPVRWARTSGERWLVAGRAGLVPYLRAWVAHEA